MHSLLHPQAESVQTSKDAGFAKSRNKGRPKTRVDWSLSLGSGGVAQNMFPAKFGFNVNATPSCTLDFVVFALNVAGTATQANLVGVNQLYRG